MSGLGWDRQPIAHTDSMRPIGSLTAHERSLGAVRLPGAAAEPHGRMFPQLSGNHHSFMTRRAVGVAYSVGLAALYAAAAPFGHVFDTASGFASMVWLPAGVSLAALFLFGDGLWPGVFIGSAIANHLIDSPAVALAIGVGNTGAALIGAWLLRRVSGFTASLTNVRSVVALARAALAAAIVSATVGVISLYLGHFASADDIPLAWRSWGIGDVVGILVVTPMIFVWIRPPRTVEPRHWIEACTFGLTLLAVVTVIMFGDAPFVPAFPSRMHDATALLVVLLWAALRFGPRGVATATFCATLGGLIGTRLGYGPFFEQGKPFSALFSFQSFSIILATALLLLGAHVSALRQALADANELAKQAARANRTKSDFLAVMSHELRTPLNAIAGYAQLLKEGIHGDLNDKQCDAVERILRNEKQLLGHVENVFEFVSAEAGEVTLKRQTVYLSEAFGAVESTMRPEFRDRNCRLSLATVETNLAVQADPKALQRILANLLSNGSKFCGAPGVVTLDADQEGDFVRISVHDNGPGISEDKARQLFEPFSQADGGLTRRSSGIGMGLTIARDLAEAMHGEIALEGAASGTTASVLLPKA